MAQFEEPDMNVAGPFQHYPPAIDNDPAAGSLSMIQVGDFLGREWRLIVLVTALAVMLWGGYIAVSPFRYTAEADMIIDTKRVVWTQAEMTSENHMVEDAAVESEIETTPDQQKNEGANQPR